MGWGPERRCFGCGATGHLVRDCNIGQSYQKQDHPVKREKIGAVNEEENMSQREEDDTRSENE